MAQHITRTLRTPWLFRVLQISQLRSVPWTCQVFYRAFIPLRICPLRTSAQMKRKTNWLDDCEAVHIGGANGKIISVDYISYLRSRGVSIVDEKCVCTKLPLQEASRSSIQIVARKREAVASSGIVDLPTKARWCAASPAQRLTLHAHK